jgi:hypothetical protein
MSSLCVFTRLSLVALALAGMASAASTTYSFQGVFQYDNDVVLFDVAIPPGVPVNTGETITMWTTSGASHGFMTQLTLFDGSGNEINQYFGGDPNCLNGYTQYASDGGCYDSYGVNWLESGDYIVALTQSGNDAPTGSLSDGFRYSGYDPALVLPYYTSDPVYGNGCTPGTLFCNYPGDSGNANWQLNIMLSAGAGVPIGTAAGPIPEPSSALLLLGGLAVLARLRRPH